MSGNEKARPGRRPLLRLFALLAALTGLLWLAGCNADDRVPPAEAPDGNPARGREMVMRYGCGSCHAISGIRTANGSAGPPLTGFGRRGYIAGKLPNNEANLVRWIMDPQQVEPGNAMPDLGVTDTDARDIAAYLYKDK
jgi:cytochrome c